METTNPLPIPIATALVKAQKASHAVEKGQTMNGAKFSYKFAGAEAVIEEARRALAEADLGVFVADWQSLGSNGHTRIAARFCLVHAEGASWMSDPVSFPAIANAGRPPDKAEASALTYVTNYYLTRLLNLPRIDSDDVSARDDSDYRPGEEPRPAKPRPAMQRSTPQGTAGDFEVRFGKFKGQMFSEVAQQDHEEAAKMRTYVAKCLADPEKAKFRDSNERQLRAMDAILGPPEPPEYGDDFGDDDIPF